MSSDTLISWLPNELRRLADDIGHGYGNGTTTTTTINDISFRLWTDTSVPLSYRLALATTVCVGALVAMLVIRGVWQLLSSMCCHRHNVWLMDVATYTPPTDWQVPFEKFMEKAEHAFHWDKVPLF